MLKYITILIINVFLLYGVFLYFKDHSILSKRPLHIGLNLILLVLTLWICYNLATIYLLQTESPQSGLLYMLAAKCKHIGLSFYLHVQPFQKEFITWTLIAMGLAFVGVISMGMIGALFLTIFTKLRIFHEIKGDNAWPAAIVVSVLWPLWLPIGILVKHQLMKLGYMDYATMSFYGTIVIGITLLVATMCLVYGTEKD
jgi:hypothetical protein